MRRKIKNIMYLIASLIPVKKRILLESHPDLSGNTYEVYKKMIERKVNENYEIIWIVQDSNKYLNIKIKNVFFYNFTPKNKIEYLKQFFMRARASLVINENKIITIFNKRTKNIFLNHGTLLKNIKGIYGPPTDVDYVVISSENIIDKYTDCFQITDKQVVVLGSPRNDVLFKQNSFKWKDLYPTYTNEKIIIWMPTFRQQRNNNRNDSEVKLPLGLPIIYSLNDLEKLNDMAKLNNIYILLKVHPAQDLNYLKVGNYSNLKVLFDEQIMSLNKNLYEILPYTDALITDYSSIYFDYLLLNKQIGLTNDDIEDYKLGFVYDNLSEVLVGETISNLSMFENFIINVALENDIYKKERIKVNNYFNKYQDEKSAERVLNLVLKTLK